MNTGSPWRKVVEAKPYNRGLYWLTLECGHETTRPVGRRTRKPMKQVRCGKCARAVMARHITPAEAILAQGTLNDWFAQENMDRRIGAVKPQRRAR